MEKKFLEKAKEALVGKYIYFGGLAANKSGFLSDITEHGTKYYLIVNGEEHSFDYKHLAELCKGECGPTKVIYNFYDLRKLMGCEVISAETEHTTNDVWRQRWWDVFFEFVKMGAYSEYSVNATSNIIKDAMKEMDNFFKDK